MKLNYKRTLFVGLAFMSICAFWQLYDNVVPLILKNTFNLGDTNIGMIMALDNIVALFLLPMFGVLSDKTNTKLGKRMPFIIVGTCLSSLMMIIMPIANNEGNLIMFIVSLAIVLLAMGTYRTSAVSLMPDVTPRPLHSQANAIINLMGAAGSIITLVLTKLLVKEAIEGKNTDYVPIYIAIIVVMVVSVIILVIKVRENQCAKEKLELEEKYGVVKEVDQVETKKPTNEKVKMDKLMKKSLIMLLVSIFLWFTAYNAVTSAFSRYVDEVWKLGHTGFTNFLMIAMIAAIVSYIPIGIISSHIGRKKTILIGIASITISYLLGCFFVEFSRLIYGVFILTGFGWAAISVNSYPMIVEMSKGGDTGKYTGYYYSISMTAQILTPILSGFLLEHVSYYTLFPYAVFFSVLSFITMLFVKHGDVKTAKKSIIESFDVED